MLVSAGSVREKHTEIIIATSKSNNTDTQILQVELIDNVQ